MDTIEILQIAKYISVAVTVLGFGVAFVLFFCFKISLDLASMTGLSRKKEIQKMLEYGEYIPFYLGKDEDEQFTDNISTETTGVSAAVLSPRNADRSGYNAAGSQPGSSTADSASSAEETEEDGIQLIYKQLTGISLAAAIVSLISGTGFLLAGVDLAAYIALAVCGGAMILGIAGAVLYLNELR